ncbi:MAG: undecaprenyl-diphosphate phosphatase [Nanoarchaeota archaeon]|nr:undecaprenyl-diphosphate phosphatase [Nanoarchaeota archaeon]
MEIIEAIILGIVQGITEWLPISSSGHLVLFQHFFEISDSLLFDLVVHLGSLIVVLIVFWKDIRKLVLGVVKMEKEHLRFFSQLVLASIPIGLIGYFFYDFLKSIFQNVKTVGFSLIFTAVVLFISKYPLKKDKKLGFLSTFIMGLFQAIAILPGVSRSGMTISAGLFQGVKKEESVRFSFLLFIPAIIGASIFEIGKVDSFGNISVLIIGFLTTVIVGVISLRLLLGLIKKGKWSVFGWYCLGLGIAALLL